MVTYKQSFPIDLEMLSSDANRQVIRHAFIRHACSCEAERGFRQCLDMAFHIHYPQHLGFAAYSSYCRMDHFIITPCAESMQQLVALVDPL